MHVPSHWAKAEHRFDVDGHHKVLAWRWSDTSVEEAAEAARARVPLYTRLCQVQGCFRARLTPKARRVGMKRIPHEWPAADDAQRLERERWIAAYREQCRGFGTCRLIAELGTGTVQHEAARVRELHDRAALCDPGAQLA